MFCVIKPFKTRATSNIHSKNIPAGSCTHKPNLWKTVETYLRGNSISRPNTLKYTKDNKLLLIYNPYPKKQDVLDYTSTKSMT